MKGASSFAINPGVGFAIVVRKKVRPGGMKS
jgi:hypothetical protein